jgi:Ni/Fe-hydrogenase subunit HybB-like protein
LGAAEQVDFMHKQVAAPPLAAIKRKRPKWRRRLVIAVFLLAAVAVGFLLLNKEKRTTIRVQPVAILDCFSNGKNQAGCRGKNLTGSCR